MCNRLINVKFKLVNVGKSLGHLSFPFVNRSYGWVDRCHVGRVLKFNFAKGFTTERE
ncbi:hypothetical protein LJA01_25820 [Lactobacillus japonicus]|nr:hypothetical protein LJA01_25820 [Lactobacillus japonicus]